MKVKPLSPALGAEIIGIDLSVPLDDVMIEELRALWLEYQIIVIRRSRPNTGKAVGICRRHLANLIFIPF